jgi:uncharacterized protein YcnI
LIPGDIAKGKKKVLWKGANKFSKKCDRVIPQGIENNDTEENNKDGKQPDTNRKYR